MFSVVIPAYNCEKTIYGALESVRSQSKYELVEEIIVINDGSTDSTDKVVCDYIKEHQEVNIVYIKQNNHGVSHARNTGIKKAKGEWIALLDSDDEWAPNKLERQSEIVNSDKLQNRIFFLGSMYPLKIISEKKGLYKLSARELCIRNMPNTPSVIFKRSTGIELGLFDENRKYVEDIQFFQKFLLKDSYYVLAENLVSVNMGKRYFAEKGLSSNLFQMHKGRNKNTYELYKMGLISKSYLNLMLCLNWFKYLRRSLLRIGSKIVVFVKDIQIKIHFDVF